MTDQSFTFAISQDEDGIFVAQCIENPGIITDARSPDKLHNNVIEAVRAILESRAIDRERRCETANHEFKVDKLVVSGRPAIA